MTARKIYRTAAGGTQLRYVSTISDNTSTTTDDVIDDVNLGAVAPTTNPIAYNINHLTNIPTGPTGTIFRRVYRSGVYAAFSDGAALNAIYPAPAFSSASHSFGSADVGALIFLSGPTPWIAGYYTVAALGTGGVAFLDRPCATVPSPIGASWTFHRGRGALDDDLRELATTRTDTTLDASLGAGVPSVNTAALNVNHLIAIPTGVSGTTARKLYRTAIGSSQLKLLDTLANNSTTTYADTVGDAALGANAPTSNTAAANQIPLSTIPKGDANVTARKLYRRSGGAGLKLLATLGDNTTTTYSTSRPTRASAPPCPRRARRARRF